MIATKVENNEDLQRIEIATGRTFGAGKWLWYDEGKTGTQDVPLTYNAVNHDEFIIKVLQDKKYRLTVGDKTLTVGRLVDVDGVTVSKQQLRELLRPVHVRSWGPISVEYAINRVSVFGKFLSPVEISELREATRD